MLNLTNPKSFSLGLSQHQKTVFKGVIAALVFSITFVAIAYFLVSLPLPVLDVCAGKNCFLVGLSQKFYLSSIWYGSDSLYQIRLYNPFYLQFPPLLFSVSSEPLWFVLKKGGNHPGFGIIRPLLCSFMMFIVY